MKTYVHFDFLKKYLYLPLLKPFSTRNFFLIPLSSPDHSEFKTVIDFLSLRLNQLLVNYDLLHFFLLCYLKSCNHIYP